MGLKHKEIKSSFAESLGEVYGRLRDFVITPEAIVDKERQ